MKKKIFVYFVLGLVAVFVFVFLFKKEEIKSVLDDNKKIEPIEFCFQSRDFSRFDFYDVQKLHFVVDGSDVVGDYKYLPAEKDSKIGSFKGVVSLFDPQIYGWRINAVWDSLAEGIQNKEELLIEYGEDSAVAFFGEMILGPNGVYEYKDKTKLSPARTMEQIDCNNFKEIDVVENFVRKNIKKIVTNKPVLGGSWYVISVGVDPSLKTGNVVYEDGHIQSRANFSYIYLDNTVQVTNFELVK